MVISCLPVIAVVAPIIGGIIAFRVGKTSEYARNLISIAATIVSFLAITAMAPAVLKGKIIEYVLVSGEIAPLPINFRVDFLSLFIAWECSFDWILATVYSHRYMEPLHARSRYYLFMALTLSAVIGTLLTKNLFALFIFFEAMLLTSYVLVIHEETPEAMSAGRIYLFLGIATGLVMFLGILITYILAGTLDFGHGGILGGVHGSILNIIFVAFVIGAAAKAGIFPVHIWLPVAHPIAPSPASAILSGVLVKEGCYVMIRVIYDVFGLELMRTMGICKWLVLIAGITIFFGSAVAIKQTNLKTMLGYSTVSQMGYIFMGAALLTPTALQGAILHIFHHSMMKSALFLCAGAFIYKTGIRDIDKMAGMGKKMPITMTVFSIAALSMIGVPPLVGFMSKWYLCLGALEAGKLMLMAFVAVLLLSSLMNAIYFMPIIINAFFGGDEHGKEIEPDDVPPSMSVPMVMLAIGIMIFGILVSISSLTLVRPVISAIFGV
ncbi:MAG: proton-conducting transporter membrane subunit [Methanocellales archaeon]|nr:proton-conducting transporter membrane subunit [Methanocellales archaeon]